MQVMIASLSRAIQSCLVEPGRLGVVHSTFDCAVNIRLENEARIISLTYASAGRLPYALMLAEGSPASFPTRGVKDGQNVFVEAGSCLTIEGAQDRYDYSIADTWDPCMGKLAAPTDNQAFRELLEWAADYVHARANLAGLAPLLRRPQQLLTGGFELGDTPDQRLAKLAAPDVTGLLIALQKENAPALSVAMDRLVGFGIGGTPSGDDLLVGLLAALSRSRAARAERMHGLLAGCLEKQLNESSTTLLSLTVLRHALAGEYSEKVHNVTRLLLHPENPESLESSLQQLLLHGATSGSEMFLGICLGFLLLTVDESNTG
jgi:hypothetical protein